MLLAALRGAAARPSGRPPPACLAQGDPRTATWAGDEAGRDHYALPLEDLDASLLRPVPSGQWVYGRRLTDARLAWRGGTLLALALALVALAGLFVFVAEDLFLGAAGQQGLSLIHI